MEPRLNPAFAPWTCWEAGSGITCQGVDQIAYDEVFGLQREGRDVYISGSGPVRSGSARMTRWHTADRILLGRAGGGGPLLVHDSGVVTFVQGRDAEVAVQHGVHDFYDDPSNLDRAICEALT